MTTTPTRCNKLCTQALPRFSCCWTLLSQWNEFGLWFEQNVEWNIMQQREIHASHFRYRPHGAFNFFSFFLCFYKRSRGQIYYVDIGHCRSYHSYFIFFCGRFGWTCWRTQEATSAFQIYTISKLPLPSRTSWKEIH